MEEREKRKSEIKNLKKNSDPLSSPNSFFLSTLSLHRFLTTITQEERWGSKKENKTRKKKQQKKKDEEEKKKRFVSFSSLSSTTVFLSLFLSLSLLKGRGGWDKGTRVGFLMCKV